MSKPGRLLELLTIIHSAALQLKIPLLFLGAHEQALDSVMLNIPPLPSVFVARFIRHGADNLGEYQEGQWVYDAVDKMTMVQYRRHSIDAPGMGTEYRDYLLFDYLAEEGPALYQWSTKLTNLDPSTKISPNLWVLGKQDTKVEELAINCVKTPLSYFPTFPSLSAFAVLRRASIDREGDGTGGEIVSVKGWANPFEVRFAALSTGDLKEITIGSATFEFPSPPTDLSDITYGERKQWLSALSLSAPPKFPCSINFAITDLTDDLSEAYEIQQRVPFLMKEPVS